MPNRVECGSFNLKGETPKHPAIEYKLTTGKGANDQICGVIEFQFAASTPAPNFYGRRVYQIRLFDTFKGQHIPLAELENLRTPEIAAHIAHYVENIGPESFQNLSIEEDHSLAENPSLAEKTVRRDHTEGQEITTIAQRIFAALNPHPGSFDEGSSFSGSTTLEESSSFDYGSELSFDSRSVSSKPFSEPVSPIRGDGPRPRTKVPIPTPHPRPYPDGIANSERVDQLERTVEALMGQVRDLNTSHTDLEDRVTGLGDRVAALNEHVAMLEEQYRLQDGFIKSFRTEMLTEMDDLTAALNRVNRRQDGQLRDLTGRLSEMEGRVADNAQQLESLGLSLTERLEKTETDIHSLKQKREESNIVELQALELALEPFRGIEEYAEDLRAIRSGNLADAKLGYQALLNKHIRAKEDEARSFRGKLAENSQALEEHNNALAALEGNLGSLRDDFVLNFREFSNAYARDFEALRGGLDSEIRAREALEKKLETQQNFLRGFDEKLVALQTEQARLAAGLELQDRLRDINYSYLGDQLRAVNDKISQVQASKRDFETRTNGVLQGITSILGSVSDQLLVHAREITYLNEQSEKMAARIDEFSTINPIADILEEEKAALISALDTVLADHKSHTERLNNQQLILRQLLAEKERSSSRPSEEIESLRLALERHIRSSDTFQTDTAEKIKQLERDRDELITTVGSLKGRTRRLEQEMEELQAAQIRQSDAYRILEETLRAEIADIERDPRDPGLAEILAHFQTSLEEVRRTQVLALVDQGRTSDSIEGMRATFDEYEEILDRHTREIKALQARRGRRGRSRARSPVGRQAGGGTGGVVIPTAPFRGAITRDEYKARFMEILLDKGSSGHASGPNLVEVVQSIVKESTSKKKAIQAISILSKSISTAERELGQALIGDRNPDDVLKHIKKATILATVLTLFKDQIASMGTRQAGDFYHYDNYDTQSLLLNALPIIKQMSEQLRDFQTRLNTLPQFQDQPPFIDEVVDELIQKHFPELADFAVAVPAIRKRNYNTWKFDQIE